MRKSIRAIGQCAVKIEEAAERCVNVLLDLIATRVSYVVQESIVVIKVSCLSFRPTTLAQADPPLPAAQDIFRRYPHRYEGIIPTLCASLDELDEPEAKASLIWILGEYADKISNASELIGSFLDTYADEPVQVQLQTLTAVVKLFLHRPEEAQQLVQRVLALATKTADSADLRDRAYIQWRLLSSDVEVAKVRSPFPPLPGLPLSWRAVPLTPPHACPRHSPSSSRPALPSLSRPPPSHQRSSTSSSASSGPSARCTTSPCRLSSRAASSARTRSTRAGRRATQRGGTRRSRRCSRDRRQRTCVAFASLACCLRLCLSLLVWRETSLTLTLPSRTAARL